MPTSPKKLVSPTPLALQALALGCLLLVLGGAGKLGPLFYNLTCGFPILTAFAISLLIGLPLGLLVIRVVRKFDWFSEDVHIISRKQFEKRLDEVFDGRNRLDDETFYSRFFSGSEIREDIPPRIRRVFEEGLEVDLSRMGADDDFSTDLRCFWDFDSLADIELMIALEREFGVKFSDSEAAETKTLRRIAEMIDAKLKQKPGAGSS